MPRKKAATPAEVGGPMGHVWMPYRGYTVCRLCGMVRPKGGASSKCRGRAKATIRGQS